MRISCKSAAHRRPYRSTETGKLGKNKSSARNRTSFERRGTLVNYDRFYTRHRSGEGWCAVTKFTRCSRFPARILRQPLQKPIRV